MSSGGKGGGGGTAKDYYGTIAGLICAGPVDELVAIIADGKTVWPDAPDGDWKTSTAYTVGDRVRHAGRVWSCVTGHTSSGGNAPGAGAQWTEYTLKRSTTSNPVLVSVVGFGTAVFYWGTASQTLSGDVPEFAADHPPYRHQCFAILKDWLFGRERTSAPNVEFVVRRAPAQTVITGAPTLLDGDGQANPLAAVAEILTNQVFGAGLPSGVLEPQSWQSTADALTAEAATTHLSTVIRGESVRAVVETMGPYFDGWGRWNSDGLIEVGRFPRHEAPPVIPDSHTITVHDLIEEMAFEAPGWAGTSSDVTVKYKNRLRAFKDGAATASNLANRAVTGEYRPESLDRPWITRAEQAAQHAAELAKILGEPFVSGSIVVRRERTDAIQPGDLFRLNHEALGLSVICRCEGKSLSEPPSTRATIRFTSHRGLSDAPIFAAPEHLGGAERPDPETVTLFQFVQAPPQLVGGEINRLYVLAARTSPVSLGMRVHVKETDSTLFYDLGAQESWAVTGTLQQAYGDNLPSAGTEPPDDNTETLRVTLDAGTVLADLAKVGETQTADAINDGNLLVWIFRASNPKQFEVMTLREIRVVGAETFYRLKVRRNRFGTVRRSFSTGDRVFILHRSSLVAYTHSRFASYSGLGTTATFRLQAYNAWGIADLADPVLCPDRSYQFADLFAPTVSWQAIQYRESPSDPWADVTDFAVDRVPAGQWRLVARVEDTNGDLSSAVLLATSGILSTTLATFAVSGTSQDVETVFSLAEGDWTLILRATDSTGRQIEQQLVPVGGGSPVVIQSRGGSPTIVANPVASPRGGFYSGSQSVALTCSTPGSTIEYQIQNVGVAAGGTWTTYTAAVSVQVGKSLYARATKAGMTTSAVVRNDYRFRDPDFYGGGYAP